MSQWILGSYLYLGYPKVGSFTFWSLPSTVLVGAVTGHRRCGFWTHPPFLSEKKNQLRNPWQLALVAIIAGLTMATMALFAGSNAIGSGTELITDLLFKPNQVASWEWAVIRFIGCTISYLSGCAGGIFAPSLSVGAAMGSQLASWIQSDNSNLMVLLGMIGFLTGVTRAPFTAFVLVLEMTDHHGSIFPMMLSALVAYGVAKLIEEHSFYEHMKDYYLQQS